MQVLRILVLVLVLDLDLLPSCWTFTCPTICRCSARNLLCSRDTEKSGARTVRCLSLIDLPLKMIQSFTFNQLINVTRIEISQSDRIALIQERAFLALHSLAQISVQNIRSLRSIEKGAFTDLPKLEYLSICNTGLSHFPDFSTVSSLARNFILEMVDNPQIRSIPPNAFKGVAEELLYMNLRRNGFREARSHAFNGTKLNSLILRNNRHLSKIHEEAFDGLWGPTLLDVSSTALRALPPRGLQQVRVLKAVSALDLKVLPPLQSLSELMEAELTYPSHCCAFQSWRHKQRENALRNITRHCDVQGEATANGVDDLLFQYTDLDCLNSFSFNCSPKPDAFNPCEDLLGSTSLRLLSWLITLCAISGNLAVLLILVLCRQKFTTSRFLMCNLAFADLCMGLYLMLIACMDFTSRREYYNHATYWQTGAGCAIAGFLTVFASELSVYTLTVISLERWHTIINAMHVTRRLRLRHVASIMAAGWSFSLLVALLPLVGVSSYSKVSICLPMDIETPASQVYVMLLLVLNVVAFLVVCCCYICIYQSVHNPEMAMRRSDRQIAKRMAVLIFTDFLCLAPISFFAISAALRMPLITVSHSKILLILFYPLNSLCNPFLYTIFTRAFRRDLCLMLRCCGRCHRNADALRSHGLPVNTACTGSFLTEFLRSPGLVPQQGSHVMQSGPQASSAL